MAVQYRASKYLEGIGDTGIGTDNHFGEVNLQEVQNVCNTMVSDICRVYGCDDAEKLLPETLIKTNVVKAQMAEWLYTAIDLLNHCCLPLMSSARTTIENLQEEKICDQRTVIELQKKLISKKDEELGLVSQTVVLYRRSSKLIHQPCSRVVRPHSRRRTSQQPLKRSPKRRTEQKKSLFLVSRRRLMSVSLQKFLVS